MLMTRHAPGLLTVIIVLRLLGQSLRENFFFFLVVFLVSESLAPPRLVFVPGTQEVVPHFLVKFLLLFVQGEFVTYWVEDV